jgi:purine-nucleoside phosphorylase
MLVSDSFRAFEENVLTAKPRLAIVLGSGLASAIGHVKPVSSVAFSQIPGLCLPSVPGHEGRLTLGNSGGKTVLVLQGRLHFYEGLSWEVVTRPMRVIHSLGAKLLLATNAAGGIHPHLAPGSLMVIRDHLDWTQPFAWRFPSGQRAIGGGAARPSPYSTRLIDLLQQAAARLGMTLLSGSYAAVTGPNYETPAEIRALAKCGADAVGMSTAREIETACELGMECSAISCITNRAAGLEKDTIITHQEVLDTAAASGQQLARLIEAFIELVG